MLAEKIKSQVAEAVKTRHVVRKNILRVVMGELSTIEGRTGKKSNDAETVKVIKKIVQSNQETQKYLDAGSERYNILSEENGILESLLPKTLSVDEIVQILSTVDVKTPKEGQAIGIAVKYLATNGHTAAGEDVAAAVRKIRG